MCGMHTAFAIVLLCGSWHLTSGVFAPQCPNNWMPRPGSSYCYRFYATILLGWSDARAYCQASGGDLIEFTSVDEKIFVSEIVAQPQYNVYSYWIGLSSPTHDDQQWTWVDGTPYTFAQGNIIHWDPGEPNDYAGEGEWCVELINSQSGMNDRVCAQEVTFICKRSIDTPLKCDANWDPMDGECLLPHYYNTDFESAREDCQGHGGDVMTLTAMPFEQYLLDYLEQNNYDYAWIGMYLNSNGQWQWINNVSGIAAQWAPGEPKKPGANESLCAVLSSSDGLWHTQSCMEYAYFVCEKPEGDCYSGWDEYNKKCYQTNVDDASMLTWFEAREVCLEQNATMVHIDSEDTDIWVWEGIWDNIWIGITDNGTADPAHNGHYFWSDTGKDVTSGYTNFFHTSPTPPPTPSPPYIPNWANCVYKSPAYDGHGYWYTEGCNYTNYFMCEAAVGQKITILNNSFANNDVCPTNWQKFGSNCYYFNTNEQVPWTVARDYCHANYSSLVSVLNAEEQSFLNSIMGPNGNYWIGLNDRANEGYYMWDDVNNPSGDPLMANSYTNWQPGQPDNYQDENCILTDVTNLGGGSYGGQWDDLQCMYSEYFVCKQPAQPAGSTTPPPGTTTPWPWQCGPYWVYEQVSGYCYRASEESNSWGDALDACTNWGGNLASLHTLEESAVVLTYVRQFFNGQIDVWLGSNDQAIEGGWVWSDGTAFNYLNWAPGEPNNGGPWGSAENCGEMYGSDGTWNDLDCESRRPYLCKKPGPGALTTTTPYTTPMTQFPGQHWGCPSPFQAYGHKCYLWSGNNDQLAWADAKTSCRKMGGDLASIHSSDENNNIMATISGYTSWVGLNDLQTGGLYVWSDDSITDYTNWNAGEPNNYEGNEHCIEVYSNGLWNDDGCYKPFPYICETDMTMLAPTSFPPTDSGCDVGYVAYYYSCYFYADSTTNSWNNAQTYCTGLGGHLVYVNDRFEQAFVTAQLGQRKNSYWIGATDSTGQGIYTWADGSTIDYTNWDQNYPDPSKGQCVLATGGEVAGLWENTNCGNSLNFVCEVPRRGWSPPVAQSTTTLHNPKCADSSWSLYKGMCYQAYDYGSVGTQLKSWQDAQSYCANIGGNLASIHDADTNTFIMQTVTQWAYDPFWIGLNTLNGAQEWSDNSPVDYTNWASGQPDNNHGNEQCIEYTSYTGGLWDDAICAMSRNWICEVPADTPLMTTTPAPKPTASPKCNNDPSWVYFNESCYYIAPWWFGATWRNARASCQSMNANTELVSIHSYGEENFVLSLMQGTGSWANGYWIGLTALFSNNDQYQWSDGTFEDFTYWAPGEPNNGGFAEAESCVEYYRSSGEWNDYLCTYQIPWICKWWLNGLPPTPTYPPPPTGNCPAGWFMAGNKCLKIFEDGLYWQAALETCRAQAPASLHPDLASIPNVQVQLAITAQLKFNQFDMWIGLSDQDLQDRNFVWSDQSEVTYTNWNPGEPNDSGGYEHCVEMYYESGQVGKWNDLDCYYWIGYICEQDPSPTNPTQAPAHGCPAGYTAYGDSCYIKTTAVNSWQEAEAQCRNLGSFTYLTSIESMYEQAFLQSWTWGDKTDYWIGMNDLAGTRVYVWADGWPVLYSNWGQNEPSANAGEGCVVLRNDGYWDDILCNSSYAGICKFTSDTKPTIQPPSYCTEYLSCPPTQNGIHWIDAGGCDCYWYSTQALDEPTAENQCFALGAHLTSIHSTAEDNWITQNILPQMSTDPWIGLVRDHEGGFIWLDGTPTDYTNWSPGEPNDSGGVENCVQKYTGSGQWNDLVCTAQHAYICKTPKIPTPATTWHAPTNCFGSQDWFYFAETQDCYYVSQTYNDWYSWTKSRAYCQSMGADLASIHTQDEQNFINNIMLNHGWSWVNTYWIGLSLLYTESGFGWSDQSVVDFYNWNPGEPNNWDNSESCVEVYSGSGKWNDDHCANEQPMICKRSSSTAIPPSTPIPTPIQGNCPAGWLFYPAGSKCYRFFGSTPSEQKSWQDARTACQSFGTSRSQYADLVSIHSSLEEDFISSYFPYYPFHVWIGLNDLRSERNFQWVDETDLDYTQWDPGEPNGGPWSPQGSEDCVEMYNEASHLGNWNDLACTQLRGYVCELNKNPNLPYVTPPPFYANFTCPAGFAAYDYTQACYMLTPGSAGADKAVGTSISYYSWQDAQNECQKLGANLASVIDPYEEANLRILITSAGITDGVWIGLERQSDNQFAWVDQWPVLYSDWGNGQPSNQAGENCVEMRVDPGWGGTWDDTQCQKEYAGVCKYSTRPPPVQPTAIVGSCPPSANPKYPFLDAGTTSCYQVVPDAGLTMGDANLECQKQGAHLASFHSIADINFLVEIMTNMGSENMWIGLIRATGGGFLWTDGTSVDFTNWAPGEPNDSGNLENCVEMYKSGQWNDNQCSVTDGYICQVPKIPLTVGPSTTTLSTNPFIQPTNGQQQTVQPQSPPGGFPPLGIAGAVLAAIVGVIFVLSAYLSIQYYRNNRVAAPSTVRQTLASDDDVETASSTSSLERPAKPPRAKASPDSSRTSTFTKSLGGMFKRNTGTAKSTDSGFGFENASYAADRDSANLDVMEAMPQTNGSSQLHSFSPPESI